MMRVSLSTSVLLMAFFATVSCRAGIAGPSPAVTGNAARFFDPAAEAAAKQATRELDQARPALTVEGDSESHVVTNCRDYLHWRALPAQPATDHDGAATSNYLMCAIVALAPGARRGARSYFDEHAIGDAIYRSLDLTTFVSSLSAEADAGRSRLAAMKFKHVDVSAVDVKAETPDWNYDFHTLAMADFDGDGLDDLLVAFTDDAKRGTAFVATTLLLRRTEANAPIQAELPRAALHPSAGAE